jgi:rhamnosyltransferase
MSDLGAIGTKPEASVVIRCHNEEKHIGDLLKAIMNQSVQNLQLIVVDSGSTDSTLSVVAQFPVEIVNIKPTEFSFGRSLNAGCSRALADYIVIASAHVCPVSEAWIAQLLLPFKENNVGLVYGRQRGNSSTKFSEHQVFAKWFPAFSVSRQNHPFCNNANAAIRKSLWDQFHYNEELTGLEDIEWAHQLQKMGYDISYSAEAEVIHIHEETWIRIFNRYRREAIALKNIFPHEHFGFWDFIRLFPANVISDYVHALRQKSMLENLMSILKFRFMQFWGTYRGFAQSGPVTSMLKRTFYYPNDWIYRNEQKND